MKNKIISLLELLHYLKDGIILKVKYNGMIYHFDNKLKCYINDESFYLLDILSLQNDVDFIESELEIVDD